MQRKKYTKKFKRQVVKKAMEIGNSSAVAKRYNLSNSTVARWVREFKESQRETNNYDNIAKENQSLLQENEQLKKSLAIKTRQIMILKNLTKKQTLSKHKTKTASISINLY